MTTQHAIHAFNRIENIQFKVRALHDAETGAEIERVSWHDQPEYGRRLIDMTESGSWRRLRITVECVISIEQWRNVIGSRELPESAAGCQVILSSRATKLRQSVSLTTESAEKYSGTLIVSQEDVASAFNLQVKIARLKPLVDWELRRAAFEGALLGESEPVTVVLDKSELPYTGPFRLSWRSFSQAQEEEIRKAAGAPVFVRTDGPPTVLLNEDLPDLKVILMGTGGSAARRRSAAVAALIGAAVWRQLAFAAVASIERIHESEQEVYRTPADWKGSIVRSLASYLYPNTDIDEAIGNIYASFTDPHESQALFSSMGGFADIQAKGKQLLSRAAQNARKIGEEA